MFIIAKLSMPNYKQSKIYYIINHTTNLKYVGSTTNKYLSQRLQKHLSDYKKYLKGEKATPATSHKVLTNDNFEILLLENFPCNSKEELLRRERFFIESNECVNKLLPTRTNSERNEKYKQLRIEHNARFMIETEEPTKKINEKYIITENSDDEILIRDVNSTLCDHKKKIQNVLKSLKVNKKKARNRVNRDKWVYTGLKIRESNNED